MSEPSATTVAPPAPAAFGTFLAARAVRRRLSARRPVVYAVSVLAHVAVLGLFLLRPSAPTAAPPAPVVEVSFLTFPRQAPPPPPPPPPAAGATPVAARRANPTPRPRPVVVPKEIPPPVVEPTPAPTVESAPTEAPAGATTQASGGTEGGTPGGTAGGTVGGMVGGTGTAPARAAAPPPLSPEQKRALLDRYLKQIHARMRAFFRYPAEAERLGVEGQVLLRASIDGAGGLRSISLAAACPDELLCDAAKRTLQAAAPFPPPPPELGGQFVIPVNYTLN